MKYDLKKENEKLVVSVEGELDVRTSPELEKALFPVLEGVKELEFDLSGLQYITSAGLRVLLSAAKAMEAQGDMLVRNAGEVIMEVFEITGFDELLHIER